MNSASFLQHACLARSIGLALLAPTPLPANDDLRDDMRWNPNRFLRMGRPTRMQRRLLQTSRAYRATVGLSAHTY